MTDEQACTRRKADGFKINGEIYIKPDRFKGWVPTQPERAALKEQKVILTERRDTATVERKIGSIKGKPRYYAIDFEPCAVWHRSSLSRPTPSRIARTPWL